MYEDQGEVMGAAGLGLLVEKLNISISEENNRVYNTTSLSGWTVSICGKTRIYSLGGEGPTWPQHKYLEEYHNLRR